MTDTDINEQILLELADLCASQNKSHREDIQELMSQWDSDAEVIPLELYILSRRDLFKSEQLAHFYSVLDGHNFYTLYEDLIHYYQTDVAAPVYFEALQRAYSVFLSEDFYRSVLRFIDSPLQIHIRPDRLQVEKETLPGVTEERLVDPTEEADPDQLMMGPGINALVHYIQSRLNETAKFADTPRYIRVLDIDLTQLNILKDSNIHFDMTIEELARAILAQKDISEYDYDFQSSLDRSQFNTLEQYEQAKDEEFEELLIRRLSELPAQQIAEIIQRFRIPMKEIAVVRNDADLFRIFGPVHPYPDDDYSTLVNDDDQPDENKIYGGARMFLDMRREADEDTGIALEDWFTGSCGSCSQRIRYKHYAVRQPVLNGGWTGCFCSWDCVQGFVESTIYPYREEGDEPEEQKENVLVANLALIQFMSNQMDALGIADRDYPEDPEEEIPEPDPSVVENVRNNLILALGTLGGGNTFLPQIVDTVEDIQDERSD